MEKPSQWEGVGCLTADQICRNTEVKLWKSNSISTRFYCLFSIEVSHLPRNVYLPKTKQERFSSSSIIMNESNRTGNCLSCCAVLQLHYRLNGFDLFNQDLETPYYVGKVEHPDRAAMRKFANYFSPGILYNLPSAAIHKLRSKSSIMFD